MFMHIMFTKWIHILLYTLNVDFYIVAICLCKYVALSLFNSFCEQEHTDGTWCCNPAECRGKRDLFIMHEKQFSVTVLLALDGCETNLTRKLSCKNTKNSFLNEATLKSFLFSNTLVYIQ